MPNPIAVLPLDVTGLSLTNKIVGETHSPVLGTRRMIIPRYGAFFEDNLRVYDTVTNADLTDDQFSLCDLWQDASAASGKSVFNTIIVTDPSVSAEIGVEYQAYGGPNSRNAIELVEWLTLRRSEMSGGIDWSEITDIPKRFKPAEHKHLLAHVYGWERVVQALGDIRNAVEVGSGAAWDEANRNIDAGLESLRLNTNYMLDSMVLQKFNEWKATLSLFQFGLDLMGNYSLANERAGLAAGPVFATPSYEDDRYVNLRGLGYFAKALIDRVVESATTNLGSEFGLVEDPQRGSIYVARIGTVFTLPSPSEAASLIKRSENMYPTGYPVSDQFIISKISADSSGTGCFLKGYNQRTGEVYLGILQASRCSSPLTWHRYYFEGDSFDLKKLVEDHIKANNNPHDVDKEDILLEKVDNLPVVSVDDILSRTATKKLVTLDALLYHMRAHMEGIELVRGDDGLVDLEANPMNDAKIIFAPCKDDDVADYDCNGNKYPPKDQFISSFCDGTDKYVRWTDGKGGYTDKLGQADSDDCKYFNMPKQGEKLSEFCEGYDKKVKYADGKGGFTTETIKVNDKDCGYGNNKEAGSVIATFCSGVNQMVRYADGHGGYYDMPSMINTYLCGGTIYPSTGGGSPGTPGQTPEPGQTPAPGSVTMEYATSHTTITPGTSETITATLRGGAPNKTYEIEFWLEGGNLPAKQSAGKNTVTTDAQGTGIRILTVVDDGVLVPRGSYTSWVECAEFQAVSNTVVRTFAGSGTPPGTPGAAAVVYSSTHSTISVGTVETITTTLTGAAPNTTYAIEYWLSSPTIPAPQTRLAGTGSITTNSSGSGTHTITNPADDGVTIPRAVYQSWSKVPSLGIESPKVVRTFVGGASPLNPTIVYSTSHTTISPGTVETIKATIANAAPNTTYAVEYWLFSTSIPAPQTRQGGSGTITTDAQGNGSHIITSTDDGVSLPRGVYQSWAKAPSLGIESVKVNRTFIGGASPTPAPTNPPVNASVVYSTTHTTIKPGDVETITATINNAAPNTVYAVELWLNSPTIPAPQTRLAGNATITTNSLGNGTYSVTNPPDDGVSIPRGIYTSWAAVPALNKSSPTVQRSFVGTPAPTAAPINPTLEYKSTHTNVTAGTTETITTILKNAARNTTYQVELWLYSPAIPSPQTRKSSTVTITTDASGTGSNSFSTYDDGVTLPRGQYTCWAVCPALNNLASPQVVRNFIGTPAPTAPPYNPAVFYSSSHSTIQSGTNETQYVRLSGMTPRSTYQIECWWETTTDLRAYGYYPDGLGIYRGVGSTVNITTGADGAGSTQFTVYDNGATPRGTYTCFARIVGLGVESGRFNRYLV